MEKRKTGFKKTEIGMIPEDWEVKVIKELAVINQFNVGKSYGFEDIEYIDIASVDKGRIVNVQKLPLKEAPSRAKRIVKDNDILLSTVRPNLKHFAFITKAEPNMVASTGFAVITAKKVEPRFLYYYLTTDKYTDYLSAIADTHTSAYPSFNPDIIENSYIPFPPFPEQRAIAKILSDLDSKIELNQKMNKTLEAIGQAIFKRWFIDFEFPNEEGKPYKSSGGEMVDSELGQIPKRWERGIVADEFNLTMGQSPPGKTYNESGEGILFFQGRTDFGFRYPKERVYCTRPTRFAEPGDTLVSVRAPVGDINMALKKCCIGRGLAAIRHKTGSRSYTYYAMHRLKEEFNRYEAEGTVFGSITKGEFLNMEIIIPPPEIIHLFEKAMFPLDQRIENNEMELNTLLHIRDALLPRLMSGKIRVPIEML